MEHDWAYSRRPKFRQAGINEFKKANVLRQLPGSFHRRTSTKVIRIGYHWVQNWNSFANSRYREISTEYIEPMKREWLVEENTGDDTGMVNFFRMLTLCDGHSEHTKVRIITWTQCY